MQGSRWPRGDGRRKLMSPGEIVRLIRAARSGGSKSIKSLQAEFTRSSRVRIADLPNQRNGLQAEKQGVGL
jgi:hypothetical protein